MHHRCTTYGDNKCATRLGFTEPQRREREQCRCACCGSQCQLGSGCDASPFLHNASSTTRIPDAERTPTDEDPNPWCGGGVRQDAYQFLRGGDLCRTVCLPAKWSAAAHKRGVRYGATCWDKGCRAYDRTDADHGVKYVQFSCEGAAPLLGEADPAIRAPSAWPVTAAAGAACGIVAALVVFLSWRSRGGAQGALL